MTRSPWVYVCIKCGKKLSIQAWMHTGGRCPPCEAKRRQQQALRRLVQPAS
jgi:DNA-directed RNA polymerase subunit RPC12/RpoP